MPVSPVADTGTSSPWTKLRTDINALITELQTLAAKSDLTISDLQSLASDSQSIFQAGFTFNFQTLNPVISELATAVAGITSTSQAQSDFTALFSGSTVSSTIIGNTFADLVKAIQDSDVTTTDLSTVAADEAAIRADLPPLPTPILPLVENSLTVDEALPITVNMQPFTSSVQPIPANGQSTFLNVLTIPVNLLPNPVTATPIPGSVLPNVVSVLPNVVSVPPIVLSVSPSVGSVPPSEPLIPIVYPIPISPPFIGPFPTTSLLASLSYVGVVTGPIVVSSPPTMTAGSSTSVFAQLEADVQKLQTELQTLAAKSGVTIADLQSLVTDGQTISQAGFHFSFQTLNPVISELAVAIAGDMSTSQAQSDFTALFSGSSVSSTVITSTFNDLSKAIGDSKVNTTDLSSVAADEAAIQTDLKNLFPCKTGGTGTGSGTGGTTGTGTTGSGSTGSSKSNGHHPTRHPTSHVAAHVHSTLRSNAAKSKVEKRK